MTLIRILVSEMGSWKIGLIAGQITLQIKCLEGSVKNTKQVIMRNINERFFIGLSHISSYLILCILLMVITGCATGEKVTGLSPGMSQADVVGAIGRPDGFRTEGDYTILKYTNRLISGWSWDRADYFVILKGDKVTEYGSGEVREKNVGGIHTIFIHQ